MASGFTKGQGYTYGEIKRLADNDYDRKDYGELNIGESFIVLLHTGKDITVSFMLTGFGRYTEYTCIYTD